MQLLNLFFGLGIFLFGMLQLERGIQGLGSQWVKHWLIRSTGTPLTSVFSGTVITAILQSSSMVSLLVLAFASASLLPLYNAIGVLLGANLGTTFTGWIVTTLGFKLDLSAVAVPAIGLGGLLQVFMDRSLRARTIGTLLLTFGLLLFGLDVMKTSVENLPQHINLEQLNRLSTLNFFLLGCALSAIIQSSSATMMLALAALNSGILELHGAATLIIGANLGTTSTTILGSIKGSPIKRQLAFAHVMFNLVSVIVAFTVLLPLLPLLMTRLGISDSLYSLAAFHTCFNLLGVLIFTPVLRHYANWIGTMFQKPSSRPLHLSEIAANTAEAALTACEQHTYRMLMAGIGLNLRNLKIDPRQLGISNSLGDIIDGSDDSLSFEQRYEQLKRAEGELVQYISSVQQFPLDDRQSAALLSILDCCRRLVYAVKTLKDIRSDLIDLRHNSDPLLTNLAQTYYDYLRDFYQKVINLLDGMHEPLYVQEQLEALTQANSTLEEQLNDVIQPSHHKIVLDPHQLSTLLNINREIHHSGKNLLQALQRWYEI